MEEKMNEFHELHGTYSSSGVGNYGNDVEIISEEDEHLTIYQSLSINSHDKYKHIFETVYRAFDSRMNQTDVKIHIGNRFIRVHRSILAMASPILTSLFQDIDPYNSKELIVSIPDLHYSDCCHLLEFLYRGEIVVEARKMKSLQNWLSILGISLSLDIEEKSSKDSKTLERVEDRVDKVSLSEMSKLEKLLSCSICDKEFKYSRDLKDHYNVHSSVKGFSCDSCPSVFSTKKQMFNHRIVHKSCPQPCPECGKNLKNIASYKAHLRNHERTKEFECVSCGKRFKRNFDLKMHERIHSGDKPYSCSICHKKFSLTSSLAKHKRFHSDIFPCSICFKAHSSTESLSEHMRLEHENRAIILLESLPESFDEEDDPQRCISLSFDNIPEETTIVMDNEIITSASQES